MCAEVLGICIGVTAAMSYVLNTFFHKETTTFSNVHVFLYTFALLHKENISLLNY